METEKPRMNVDLSKTLAGDNKVCFYPEKDAYLEGYPL